MVETIPTTGDAFLRAICKFPADDAPRLEYADWLEENVKTTTCLKCHGKGSRLQTASAGSTIFCAPRSFGPEGEPLYYAECPDCNGRGGRSNGFAERAEFIRVQCELARRWPDNQAFLDNFEAHGAKCTCDGCHGRKLRRREQELFARHWWDWCPEGFKFDRCDGSPDAPPLIWRRGFAERVELVTAAFIGGPCGRCAIWLDRGMPADAHCPACRGAGRAPGVAGPLFAGHPVAAVNLTNKRPYHGGEGTYDWWPDTVSATPEDPESDLPEAIFRLMPGRKVFSNGHHICMEYATAAAAHAALSAACVKYGRRLAGLAPHEAAHAR